MLFSDNDYSRGLAGHMRPVTSVVRPASAQCCWLCHLLSDGLVESERHRSQKIYRFSEENRSKWVLFRIAIYRSSGYNPIFCPAVSAELLGVWMFWNPTDARTYAPWTNWCGGRSSTTSQDGASRLRFGTLCVDCDLSRCQMLIVCMRTDL